MHKEGNGTLNVNKFFLRKIVSKLLLISISIHEQIHYTKIIT